MPRKRFLQRRCVANARAQNGTECPLSLCYLVFESVDVIFLSDRGRNIGRSAVTSMHRHRRKRVQAEKPSRHETQVPDCRIRLE